MPAARPDGIPVPIRVLTVDDSPFYLEVLAGIVRSMPGAVLAGSARNGRDAVDRAAALAPDVITLDVEMPEMDGLTALPLLLSACPARVIMVSSHTRRESAATIRALALGAADFVAKPGPSDARGLDQLREELVAKVEAVGGRQGGAAGRLPGGVEALARAGRPRLIVLGASTGGIAALSRIARALPARPRAAIVAVQHLPGAYASDLEKTLGEAGPCPVALVRDGDLADPGRIYLARGGFHLGFYGATFRVSRGSPVNGFMPSVDVTMDSAARGYGAGCCGVLLTGLGRDGAEGMAAVHDAGGFTIAQDEATSVVWGMPRAAVETGRVDCVLGIEEIADAVARLAG